MFPHPIDENGDFRIDDTDFRIRLPLPRPPSEPGKFTIVKDRSLLDIYGALSRSLKPRAILELGVFQGGSYLLLDKLFQPERMAAVEISKLPVAPLVDYCRARAGRSVHFGASQADEAKLKAIVADDLGGALDLVVDDASHMYDLTRRSFEILFPLLAPGGTYIIEDWQWSHLPPYQGEAHPWRERPALTNFIFELVALQGSTLFLNELRVLRPLVVIRKSRLETPPDFLSRLKLRGRRFTPLL